MNRNRIKMEVKVLISSVFPPNKIIMKIFFKVLITFFFIVSTSCARKTASDSKETEINQNNTLKINISGNIDDLIQADSIFENITVIPLETKEECLITDIGKVLFFKDKMFLQNKFERLLVFSLDGKFHYEVGKHGRGPGEFNELRDFDIDKEGNIYILDYLKIFIYKNNGDFKKCIDLRYVSEACYPIQFSILGEEEFMLWGGSFGVINNLEGKMFAMCEVKQGKIINRYFPVKYHIEGGYRRFSSYYDIIILDPIYGNNTVFSIDKGSVTVRYIIDFGDKTFKAPIPEGFVSLSDFKTRIDYKYYHSITRFTETRNWIYFHFLYNHQVYNAFFSKSKNKSYLSKQWPLIPGRILPWKITGNFDDKLVAFIEPQYIIDQIKKCNEMDSSLLSVHVKRTIERLNNLKVTDNPALFICTMVN